MRKSCIFLIVTLALVIFVGTEARAALFSYNGTSGLGNPVNFSASLTIDTTTDRLTIVLTNDGPIALAPNDVLNSFYFDFEGGSPTLLGLTSAQGELYLTQVTKPADPDIPDNPYNGMGEDNLLTATGGPWWGANGPAPFSTMDPSQPPYLDFGIGSAGNNGLTPNNFGAMDGVGGGIVSGDIDSQNLKDEYLVQGSATFVLQFDSLDGLSIGQYAVFGMGTAPDSWVRVPMPAAVILGVIGLGIAGIKLRKYA